MAMCNDERTYSDDLVRFPTEVDGVYSSAGSP
jgi:hypothetical protein